MPEGDVLVLGPVALGGAAGVVEPPAMVQRLLAALVVAEGRARETDELVDALWGEEPPASARKLVRVYVSQLRKVLSAGVAVETTGSGYALRLEDGALDAARFERLLGEAAAANRDGNAPLAASLAGRALALWRGRAFGELAYEEVAVGEAARLEELRLAAVEERLEAELTLGRHDVGEVLALAHEHPLRERLQELAMLALYRSGRQSEALEHFTTVRERLADELGLEPGPELKELQRRILQQDPALAASAAATAADAPIPIPATPLVGRERELAQLRGMLERRDARLLVLTGAGGSGKTRLALEAARRAAPSFANGAVLVELAPLRDAKLVAGAVAKALDVTESPDEPLEETLARALAPRELLMVVDNAEHVRKAAPLLARLVASAARLLVLVTSRAVLHVSGEHVFPVAPLDEDDAVALFEQRARALDPSFALAGNEEDVREICRRVDGLPLAIELAAARIRTLTPAALHRRLDTRLAILTGGPRDLPARQQTLRETIAWSVDLLGEREREIFARLALFPGGATLGAAEEVCAADLDTLATLVDHHLVLRTDAGEPRFGMLETVREYALELLGDALPHAEHALAMHFAGIADELRSSAPVEPVWRRILERLDPEVDNVRVALAAGIASGDSELGLRLAGGFYRYWSIRGPAGEGLEWIERALASGDGSATAARAHALQGGGFLAWMCGDFVRAKELAEAAIAVAIEARSTWDELSGHTALGLVAQDSDDMDLGAARVHHTRALELAEQLGLEPLVQKLNLGVVAFNAGEYESAIALFEDVLDGHRRNDNIWGMGFAHLNLGQARYESGDAEKARREFDEARTLFGQIGYRHRHASALQALAVVEEGELHFEKAARLLGQARRELDKFGVEDDTFWTDRLPATEAAVREALGDEAFEAVYAAGRADA